MSRIKVIKKKPAPQKKRAYVWGIAAEWIAAGWLMLHGYKILRRRYRNKHGEIDLIALKNETVIFIEVKARKDESTALESISPRQKMRIERSARSFMTRASYRTMSMRFDVITCSPWQKPLHLINAWQPLG
jgi:putative endonuclease